MTKKRASSVSSIRSSHVALLRGINVGGKNVIPMAMLADLFKEAGGIGVRTYIQSGNVLFSAEAKCSPEAIAARVARAIHRHLGFEPAIVVRSASQMRKIAVAHPFETDACDGRGLYVGFLDARPTAKAANSLDPNRSPGDLFAVRGSEVYLLYSAAKTRLTNAYIDATLGVRSTLRNWRTVCTLADMLTEG